MVLLTRPLPDWLLPALAEGRSAVVFALGQGPLSDNGATPWFTTVGVGTPAQPLRFMLDTGTLNTWVTSIQCSTEACRAHGAFRPEASATFRGGGGGPRQVDFGPWGTMQVLSGRDVCHLSHTGRGRVQGVSLEDPFTLELAVDYSGDQFLRLVADGGLAIPAVPDTQATALLPQLHAEGLIQAPLAAFDTDPATGTGQVLFGAADPRRFDPATLNVLPLVRLGGGLDYLWTVNLEALTCGGRCVGRDIPFVLDTGSSFFKGGAKVIQALQSAISGEGARPLEVTDPALRSGYPDLALRLQGVEYRLRPEDYFMELAPGRWSVGVFPLTGLPDDLLVVGSLFLDTVYSIFKYDAPQAVALASPVRDARPTPPALRPLEGTWRNEFGSTLEIGPLDARGTFTGLYRSSTGATGVYPVVGVADPQPGATRPVAFSVTWRSLEGAPDPSWHWVSGFTGLHQAEAGGEVLRTTYLLQQDATASVPDWMATAVYPSVFTRVEG